MAGPYVWHRGTLSHRRARDLMKFLPRIILLVILAAVGFWLWTVFFPSPEKVIRKRLLNMAGDVSFSHGQNNLIQLAHAQSVADFFASNVVVELTLPGHM